MNIATFRQAFPAFNNALEFSDFSVQTWLTLAQNRLRPEAWCDMLEMGTALFVAHFLSLSDPQKRGASPALLSSKSVGPASASYDTTVSTEPGAGHWNLTIYGVQYLEMRNIAGMAVIQVF